MTLQALEAWNRIIERAQSQSFEVHTVPQNKKTPLWFRVSTDGNKLIISEAKDNEPSSTLKMSRTITFKEFERIYPYYYVRLKGTSVSQEVMSKSVNSVYIYGLIADELTNLA